MPAHALTQPEQKATKNMSDPVGSARLADTLLREQLIYSKAEMRRHTATKTHMS